MDKDVTGYLNKCVVFRAVAFYQTQEPISMSKLPRSQSALGFYKS